MKKFFFLLSAALPLLLPFSVNADESKPVIQITPIAIQGLSAEEGRIVESLLISYLQIFGEVEIATTNGEIESVNGLLMVTSELQSAGSEDSESLLGRAIPDVTISGSVAMDQYNRILILEISIPAINETAVYTSTHRTTSELLLNARALVESVFSRLESSLREAFQQSAQLSAIGEALTESGIVGTWRGDRGIELVRLQSNGRGVAIFSSGAQMNLAYTISDNTLRVMQISPNTERYYYPAPYLVAKELVEAAEPMQWEFLLFDQGNLLRGYKTNTAVVYEGNIVQELLPNTSREAEWTRLH